MDRRDSVLEERSHTLRVDARHRNVGADAIDDQTTDQKQQAIAYVAETRCVAE
jgi:hypothetical protein